MRNGLSPTYGTQLKTCRAATKQTQEAFAIAAGISRTLYAYYENDQRFPSSEQRHMKIVFYLKKELPTELQYHVRHLQQAYRSKLVLRAGEPRPTRGIDRTKALTRAHESGR